MLCWRLEEGTSLVMLALRHPMADFTTRTLAERTLDEDGYDETPPGAPDDAEAARAEEILRRALSLPADIGLAHLLRGVSQDTADDGARQAYPDGLTAREVGILLLVARGKSNREIGEELFITPNTVANHVKNILSKTGTANRTGAAAYARERGLV
jgi:DNA-binding NarL/FixJ family response regulator